MLHVEGLEDRTVLSAMLLADQPDYAPGSVAVLSASGFDEGATLRFQVTSDTDGPGQSPWLVTDGGAGDLDGVVDGAVQTTWDVDPDGAYIGATLTATATDVTSGVLASTTFTDGTINGVTVDPQSGTATYGSSNSVTFSIDVSSTGGAPRNWSLSVTGLPTGVAGSFSPVSGTATGGPNDSTLTLTTTGTGASRTLPGTYTFTVVATAGAGTAGGATGTGTLTVGKKGLTVSGITANDKVYNGNVGATLNTGGAALVGVVGGDSVSLNTGSASGTFANKNIGTSKTVTISGLSLTGAESSRYTLTAPTATASITPLAITGSITAADKIYDGTTDATITSRTLTGVIPGDTVTYTGGTATFDNKNVGPGKTVTASGLGLGGGDKNNYTVNTTATTLASILAAPLTIAAVTDTKVYDGTTISTATPTVTGLQVGDTVSPLTQAFQSKNVLGINGSTLQVSAFTVNDGNGGNNYTVDSNGTAAGTITQASLTIAAVADTKIYDGTTTSTATPTVIGLQPGDTVSPLTQAFQSKNVLGINGSTLQVSAFTVNDGNSGGNYVVGSSGTAAGTITPASLTITAVTDTKVYDGTTTSTATPTVSGLQVGDTVSPLTQAFQSRNVLGTNASTLQVSAFNVNDGNGGNNYAVDSSGTAAGTITPASLTIMAVTNTKVYDGNTSAAAVPTVTGVQAGDSVADLVEAYDNKNAGTGKTLTVVNYVVNDGNGGNNYTVNTVANTTGVITAKVLSIDSATTQNALNIAKNGTITFRIDVNESGIVDAQTVAGLFNGALFHLEVGSQTYSVPAQAVVNNGIITVSFQMSAELRSILAAYTTATNASTAPIVGLELLADSNDGNYTVDASALTRLFNTSA